VLPLVDSKSFPKLSALAFLVLTGFGTSTDSNAGESPHKTNVTNPFEYQPFTLSKDVSEVSVNYRTRWSRLTGFELSGLHWNQFVVIYTSSGLKTYKRNFYEHLKQIEADDEDEEYDPEYKTYPVGSVMLKENYLTNEGRPGKPTTLTLMIKRKPGFYPQGGDWEYIETDINGKIIIKGNGGDTAVKKRCASCHINIADRDYIFSTFLTEPALHAHK